MAESIHSFIWFPNEVVDSTEHSSLISSVFPQVSFLIFNLVFD